jgi:HSP20 family protein
MNMLVRWTPFNEMARLQQDLNKLFDTFDARPLADKAETVQGLWTPAVDVVEDADKIELMVDLPGVKQEELDIQVEKDVLTLRGSRNLVREAKGDKENFRRYERVSGGFVRSFSLPPTVDVEKIGASLKDGVLTLTLPKKPEAQPKQIKVSVQ